MKKNFCRTMFAVAVLVLSFVILKTAVAADKPYTPDANTPRTSVPESYKWDLKPLFKSDGEFESALSQVKGLVGGIQKYKGKLTNADTLASCMKDFFALRQKLDPVSMYSNLKSDQDSEVKTYENMRQKTLSFMKDFAIKVSFIRQEVLKLDDATIKNILADQKMAPYSDYLKEMIRRKSHLLGDEAETVLGLASDNLYSEVDLNEVPSDSEMVFKAATRDFILPIIKDENGKEVQLTLANYGKYRASKDRRVRKETVEAFFAALKKYNNILAASLGGEIKRDVFLAKARKYNRAIDAYLDRQYVDPKVVDNLIATVNKNVGTLHRYVALRKKLLNLPDIHIYDLYTPIVPAVDTNVTYTEAAKGVTEALKPLGDEYLSVMSKAIEPGSGWVDIYPNKGKESGAFSTSIWSYHPYVKLNYMDSLDDASTLAHEFGHAMHSYFNMNANDYIKSGYPTVLAEIASTFNETLYNDYLLNKYKNDNAMKLYLLGERLESIRTTIFRQTLFAEYEKKMHDFAEAGTPLTADLFNKTYIDLIKKYYGPNFKIDANDDIEWAYIPHFYWKFYVYAYATGLSSGISLAEKVKTEGAPARDRYLSMLKTSYVVPPIETLKKAGVDLTKPDAIEAAIKLMNQTMTEMEKVPK